MGDGDQTGQRRVFGHLGTVHNQNGEPSSERMGSASLAEIVNRLLLNNLRVRLLLVHFGIHIC